MKPTVPIKWFFLSWIYRLQNKGIKATIHFDLFLVLLYESNGWWAAASSWCNSTNLPQHKDKSLQLLREKISSCKERSWLFYHIILSSQTSWFCLIFPHQVPERAGCQQLTGSFYKAVDFPRLSTKPAFVMIYTHSCCTCRWKSEQWNKDCIYPSFCDLQWKALYEAPISRICFIWRTL